MRFGISKLPVRETLVPLREMGFVTPLPVRGYFFAALLWQLIKHLFEVRLFLEHSAVELALGVR